MIKKQFGGYIVQRKNPDGTKVNRFMYVRTIYSGRAGYVTDYGRAKVYKTKAAALAVDQKLDAGEIV